MVAVTAGRGGHPAGGFAGVEPMAGVVSLVAMIAATLLLVDAWFDVTTASTGPDQMTAIAMAVCLEVPIALGCAVLAGCTLRRHLP
ncbi:MAG: hypothetical protein JWO67_3245 [Streptosporangiaceae bacterium]|nr:hypothetical protein [Streptosporangiaceae bacterium]